MLKLDYSGCVYAAINLKNGRRYIGKTKMPLAKRIRCHKSVANKGGGQVFHAAIRKYGISSFRWDTLFEGADEAALYAAERRLIAEAKAAGERLYNRSDGGEGATGLFWSPENRRRVSKSLTGRPKSHEARRRMSQAAKGKRKSAAHVEKMRLNQTGKKMAGWTPERRAKMEAAWNRRREAGMGVSDETRQRMSDAAKRRATTPEGRATHSKAGRISYGRRWGLIT